MKMNSAVLTSALVWGDWSGLHPGRFVHGNEPSVPIGWEAEWAPETVWTRVRGEKTLYFSVQGIELRSSGT